MQRYTVKVEGYFVPGAFEVATYNIYVEEEVYLGWTGWTAIEGKGVNIAWDPTKTQLNSATLYCKIFTGSTSVGAQILFNKNRCLTLTDGKTEENNIDVLNWIRNGYNTIDLRLDRLVPLIYEARAYYTTILTLEFTGEGPKVTYPPTYLDYLKWALILGGVGIFGYLGVRAIEATRRR